VSRRVSLPGADELFRRTEERGSEPPRSRPPLAAAPAPVEAPKPVEAPDPASAEPKAAAPERPRRTASGRVRHDEKMTVYVTADELLEIEHARLVLRRSLGSAVDRGRLVRAAVAMALADLDERGDDSELVRRLTES
jgi:hypothetical protein